MAQLYTQQERCYCGAHLRSARTAAAVWTPERLLLNACAAIVLANSRGPASLTLLRSARCSGQRTRVWALQRALHCIVGNRVDAQVRTCKRADSKVLNASRCSGDLRLIVTRNGHNARTKIWQPNRKE